MTAFDVFMTGVLWSVLGLCLYGTLRPHGLFNQKQNLFLAFISGPFWLAIEFIIQIFLWLGDEK